MGDTIYTISVSPQNYVGGTPTITIEENGLVEASLKIVRVNGNSTFTQHLKLTNWGPLGKELTLYRMLTGKLKIRY